MRWCRISDGTASPPVPRRARTARRFAPTAAVLLVALLAGLSAGTAWLVARHFQDDARAMSQLYSGVFSGLNNPEPGAEGGALLQLGAQVRQRGMPLVLTDSAGRVTAADNLPSALAELPLDDPRLQVFVARLDREFAPLLDTLTGQRIHYGALPAQRQLAWLGVMQALAIVLMVAVAVFAYRNAMSAQRDRLWVAMAREAAHQMGTPLTSMQGWIESLRSPAVPPPGQLAAHPSGLAIPLAASRCRSVPWPAGSRGTTSRACRDGRIRLNCGWRRRAPDPSLPETSCFSSGPWRRW